MKGRRYHHGDLRRALVSSAQTLLETVGPMAMTLRAAARMAGVSTSAPYHHFKSMEGLRQAVAREGWRQLRNALARCSEERTGERLVGFGLTCVQFAQDHPALYSLMGQCLRTVPRPVGLGDAEVHDLFRQTVADAARSGAMDTPLRLELTTIAVWSTVHGLAEICRWKSLDALKANHGGEQAFVVAALRQLAQSSDGRVE